MSMMACSSVPMKITLKVLLHHVTQSILTNSTEKTSLFSFSTWFTSATKPQLDWNGNKVYVNDLQEVYWVNVSCKWITVYEKWTQISSSFKFRPTVLTTCWTDFQINNCLGEHNHFIELHNTVKKCSVISINCKTNDINQKSDNRETVNAWKLRCYWNKQLKNLFVQLCNEYKRKVNVQAKAERLINVKL